MHARTHTNTHIHTYIQTHTETHPLYHVSGKGIRKVKVKNIITIFKNVQLTMKKSYSREDTDNTAYDIYMHACKQYNTTMVCVRVCVCRYQHISKSSDGTFLFTRVGSTISRRWIVSTSPSVDALIHSCSVGSNPSYSTADADVPIAVCIYNHNMNSNNTLWV